MEIFSKEDEDSEVTEYVPEEEYGYIEVMNVVTQMFVRAHGHAMKGIPS